MFRLFESDEARTKREISARRAQAGKRRIFEKIALVARGLGSQFSESDSRLYVFRDGEIEFRHNELFCKAGGEGEDYTPAHWFGSTSEVFIGSGQCETRSLTTKEGFPAPRGTCVFDGRPHSDFHESTYCYIPGEWEEKLEALLPRARVEQQSREHCERQHKLDEERKRYGL